MRNIELKARMKDPAKALLACTQLQAVAHGEIHQIDTYFLVPRGRLKLREAHPSSCELIYYERDDIAGPKGCDYTRYPVDTSIKAFLDQVLGIQAVVEKQRTLYLWENVRIHLDDVKGLGQYIEFEAVLSPGADTSHADQAGYHQLAHLMQAFEITEDDCETGSYLDLVLQQKA